MIFCLLTIILIGRLSGELSGALYSPDDLQLLCGEGEGGVTPSLASLTSLSPASLVSVFLVAMSLVSDRCNNIY